MRTGLRQTGIDDLRAPESGRAGAPPSTLLVQLAAALSAVCFGLHLAMLWVDDGSMFVMIGPMLLIATVCLACSIQVWRGRCGLREEVGMLVAAGAMVCAHLLLDSLHSPAGSDGSSMHHSGGMQMDGMPMDAAGSSGGLLGSLMHLAVAVVVLQVCSMAVVLLIRYRRHTADRAVFPA